MLDSQMWRLNISYITTAHIAVEIHTADNFQCPCGLMDKASDFESEDCEFESRQGLNHFVMQYHKNVV